jgi:2,3-dihydroxybenzoate decarboxylase
MTYRRIATEEAFAPPELVAGYLELIEREPDVDPGFRSAWAYFGRHASERARLIRERLQDLGERRLADMDAAGVDRQIVSLTSPGTQIFDADTGRRMAELANDRLAEAVGKHPTRLAGLTAIAPQDPGHAAREIERGCRRLGFRGVIVNSHTNGEYLDDPKFWAIFEAAEALRAPIYLHPNTPSRRMIGPMLERGLEVAIYGFQVETGFHALSLIVAGVFDRFPNLQIVLGHLGEGLPFWMYRIDHMHAQSVGSGRYRNWVRLQRKPSEYLRAHFHVTSSGMPWAPALAFVQGVMGEDRVLYAMDYPYQYVPEEVRMSEEAPMSPEARVKFFQGNAERLFGP